jgi:catechol 2,3-dioxygenase-like lactoylglutathione lyase family enzyme
MLGAAQIVAFAATADAAKSRAFYEGVLGLKFVHEDEFAIVYDAQVELRLQKVSAFQAHRHTQLGWAVSSIDTLAKVLREKGVVFETYASLNQDQNCIWTAPSGARIAWFKDPDGNLLSLTESPKVPLEPSVR